MLSPHRRHLRATKAGLKRQNPDADTTELDRDLKAAKGEEYARELVESWPPLTDSQRMRIAAALLGSMPAQQREAA